MYITFRNELYPFSKPPKTFISYLNHANKLTYMQSCLTLSPITYDAQLLAMCTNLSRSYVQQFLLNITFCTCAFIQWHKNTYYWYVFGVNYAVCFFDFYRIYVKNTSAPMEVFDPSAMDSRPALKRHIRIWERYNDYFFAMSLVTIVMYEYSVSFLEF